MAVVLVLGGIVGLLIGLGGPLGITIWMASAGAAIAIGVGGLVAAPTASVAPNVRQYTVPIWILEIVAIAGIIAALVV